MVSISCVLAEEGIRLARLDHMDWVFHVDTDELMYPAGAADFSLQASPIPSTRTFPEQLQYNAVVKFSHVVVVARGSSDSQLGSKTA